MCIKQKIVNIALVPFTYISNTPQGANNSAVSCIIINTMWTVCVRAYLCVCACVCSDPWLPGAAGPTRWRCILCRCWTWVFSVRSCCSRDRGISETFPTLPLCQLPLRTNPDLAPQARAQSRNSQKGNGQTIFRTKFVVGMCMWECTGTAHIPVK